MGSSDDDFRARRVVRQPLQSRCPRATSVAPRATSNAARAAADAQPLVQPHHGGYETRARRFPIAWKGHVGAARLRDNGADVNRAGAAADIACLPPSRWTWDGCPGHGMSGLSTSADENWTTPLGHILCAFGRRGAAVQTTTSARGIPRPTTMARCSKVNRVHRRAARWTGLPLQCCE